MTTAMNIDSLYSENLDLTNSFIHINLRGKSVKVPLLFSELSTEFTEELKKINLRWALVYLRWARNLELEPDEYVSPLLQSKERPYIYGLQTDILGAEHLEGQFPGISEISRKASLMSNLPGVPMSVSGESYRWANYRAVSVDLDLIPQRINLQGDPRDRFKGIGFEARSRLNKLLSEVLSTSGWNGLWTYCSIYYTYPVKIGSTRSRTFLYDKSLQESRLSYKNTPNTFYIMTKSSNDGHHEFSRLTIRSNYLEICNASKMVMIDIDPLQLDFNTWLIIHILETLSKRNIKETISLQKFITSRLASFQFETIHVSEEMNNEILGNVESYLANDGVGTHFMILSRNGSNKYFFPYPFSTDKNSPKDLRKFNSLFSDVYRGWLMRFTGNSLVKPQSLPDPEPDITVPIFADRNPKLLNSELEVYIPVSNDTRDLLGDECKYLGLISKLISAMEVNQGQISAKFGLEMLDGYKKINPAVFTRRTVAVVRSGLEIQSF